MRNSLRIAVSSPNPSASQRLIDTAGFLALEWAAPFAEVVMAEDGDVVISSEARAIGGILRMPASESKRLSEASIELGLETPLELVEDGNGNWGIDPELSNWTLLGTVLRAVSFSPSTREGAAISRLIRAKLESGEVKERLLATADLWAKEVVELAIKDIATVNPNRIRSWLTEQAAELESATSIHQILRSRYDDDIRQVISQK
ncbi:MAG TPA: hypothetical protein DCP89_08245 [Acidimicrobiaceae bacterium]|nr:hypothetical protein [Actinomycetota bacterium]HAN08478.1 hypothetical protein [Acidimicrobiaceae bacterium]